MNNRAPLTKSQKKFYDKLVEFYREKNYAPSMRDMMEYGGYKSSGTPHLNCQALIKSGWIWQREDDKKFIPVEIQSKPPCKEELEKDWFV